MITRPSPLTKHINELGRPTPEFMLWIQNVSNLAQGVGNGSPEGVVEDSQLAMFMDEDGAPGAVLYIKQKADIGGDRKLGWVAIG